MAEDDAPIANTPAPAESNAAADPELALPEIEIDPASDEQPEGQADADELEEIEVDGKKGRISKALKDNLMLDADYRRKTTEVAKQREGFETREKTLAEQTQTFQRHAVEVGKLMGLNSEIAPYEKLTAAEWDKFALDNPAEANRAWIHFGQLKDQRQALAVQLDQQERKWQIEAQRDSAKRTEEGRKAIAAKVPGWSPEFESKLQQYAETQGFTKAEWAGVTDHRAVTVLDKARRYDQLVARQRAATQTAAAEPVAPAAPVGGQRGPSRDLRTLSKSEDASAYAKARFPKLNGGAARR